VGGPPADTGVRTRMLTRRRHRHDGWFRAEVDYCFFV
jgi:hypothetical protein